MKALNGHRVALFFTVGFVLASNSFAQISQPEADQVRARQKISLMESVLESAVANGADSLIRAVRAVMPPDALMLTGAPSARGFLLQGYGLFFDVEVPAFRPHGRVDAQADGRRQRPWRRGSRESTEGVHRDRSGSASARRARSGASSARTAGGPVGPVPQDAADDQARPT
jgi:hypothetical protein